MQKWLYLVLGDGSVLLHQQGGVVVDRRGVGLVSTQAAEEAGEEAAAPGLLGGRSRGRALLPCGFTPLFIPADLGDY